jgi:hypothetical protein
LKIEAEANTTDDAAYTPGSGTGFPAFALFDDVAPDSVDEGDAGILRMSANRNAYTQIRDAAGNERGVNVSAGNALLVDASATTQPVSAASLPLPTGASTAAKQPALGTAGSASSDVISIQGIASMTAVKVDGSAVTQPVSGTVTANAGSGNFTVVGSVAHDGAASGNPVRTGGVAVNAERTAVANADVADMVTDLVGKLITLPYANPENFVAGVSGAMTGTGNVQVIAAGGGSLRNYVTQITVTNSHATVGTVVQIKDGTTVIYEGFAAAAGGGFAITLPVPLRGTAATAINAANITTGSNTYVAASGYRGV